jgi:hypothetical protein
MTHEPLKIILPPKQGGGGGTHEQDAVALFYIGLLNEYLEDPRQIEKFRAQIARNFRCKEGSPGYNSSIRSIQGGRYEIFVQSTHVPDTSVFDQTLQGMIDEWMAKHGKENTKTKSAAALPKRHSPRSTSQTPHYYYNHSAKEVKQIILDYACRQARRDERFATNISIDEGDASIKEEVFYEFNNFSLLVNYGPVPAQPPHIDSIHPNAQFGLIISNDARCTSTYSVPFSIKSARDLTTREDSYKVSSNLKQATFSPEKSNSPLLGAGEKANRVASKDHVSCEDIASGRPPNKLAADAALLASLAQPPSVLGESTGEEAGAPTSVDSLNIGSSTQTKAAELDGNSAGSDPLACGRTMPQHPLSRLIQIPESSFSGISNEYQGIERPSVADSVIASTSAEPQPGNNAELEEKPNSLAAETDVSLSQSHRTTNEETALGGPAADGCGPQGGKLASLKPLNIVPSTPLPNTAESGASCYINVVGNGRVALPQRPLRHLNGITEASPSDLCNEMQANELHSVISVVSTSTELEPRKAEIEENPNSSAVDTGVVVSLTRSHRGASEGAVLGDAATLDFEPEAGRLGSLEHLNIAPSTPHPDAPELGTNGSIRCVGNDQLSCPQPTPQQSFLHLSGTEASPRSEPLANDLRSVNSITASSSIDVEPLQGRKTEIEETPSSSSLMDVGAGSTADWEKGHPPEAITYDRSFDFSTLGRLRRQLSPREARCLWPNMPPGLLQVMMDPESGIPDLIGAFGNVLHFEYREEPPVIANCNEKSRGSKVQTKGHASNRNKRQRTSLQSVSPLPSNDKAVSSAQTSAANPMTAPAGTLLTLPGSVIHAGPSTEAYRAILFFSASPKKRRSSTNEVSVEGEVAEYHPDVQYYAPMLCGEFLSIGVWHRLNEEDRVYLLTKLAEYVEIAAASALSTPTNGAEDISSKIKNPASAARNIHCHFSWSAPVKEFIRHIEWSFYERASSRSSPSPAILSRESYIKLYAQRRFPSPQLVPRAANIELDACRVVSAPNLRAIWDDGLPYEVVVFEIEKTRRCIAKRIQVQVLLFFPCDGQWAGGDEDERPYILRTEVNSRYRFRDPPYLFDGSNGSLLDSEGDKIRFVNSPGG